MFAIIIFILILGTAWGQLYDIDYQPVDLDEGPSCSEGLDFREITELLVGATCRVKDKVNLIPGHLLEDRACVYAYGKKLGEVPMLKPDGSWSDMEILVRNYNKKCNDGFTPSSGGQIPKNALELGSSVSGKLYQAVLHEDGRTFKGFVSEMDPNGVNFIQNDRPVRKRLDTVNFLSCD